MNDNDAGDVDDAAMVAMARACDFLLTREGEAPAVQRVDRHETDGMPWYAVLAQDKAVVWHIGGILAAMAASRSWGRPYVVQSPGPGAYGPFGEGRAPLRLVHGSGHPAGNTR